MSDDGLKDLTDADLFDNNKVRYVLELYPSTITHLLRALLKMLALNEYNEIKLDNDEFIHTLDLVSAIMRVIAMHKASDRDMNHPDMGYARIEIKVLETEEVGNVVS